jgi:hypothetical protein
MLGTDDVRGLSWHLIHPLAFKGKLTMEKPHYLMVKQKLFPANSCTKAIAFHNQTISPWSHFPFQPTKSCVNEN